MKTSRSLRRLLRIRALEEDQSRMALEAAQAERQRLDTALEESRWSERRSRESIFEGVLSGDAIQRTVGVAQGEASERASEQIRVWKAKVDAEAARRREAFLADRLERRQTERMVETAAAETAVHEERRAQAALDDWHRMQHRPERKEAAAPSNDARRTGSDLPAGKAEPDRHS